MLNHDDAVGDPAQHTLDHIWASFNQAALNDIVGAYAAARRRPSDDALDAIGAVIGKSHNEIRRYVARAAKAQGSNFMSEHLPAGE